MEYRNRVFREATFRHELVPGDYTIVVGLPCLMQKFEVEPWDLLDRLGIWGITIDVVPASIFSHKVSSPKEALVNGPVPYLSFPIQARCQGLPELVEWLGVVGLCFFWFN